MIDEVIKQVVEQVLPDDPLKPKPSLEGHGRTIRYRPNDQGGYDVIAYYPYGAGASRRMRTRRLVKPTKKQKREAAKKHEQYIRVLEALNTNRLARAAAKANCAVNELHNRANRWALAAVDNMTVEVAH